MIKGRDSETLSAANKIRLLLTYLNCPTTIPDTLKNLNKFHTTTSELKNKDAIETLV